MRFGKRGLFLVLILLLLVLASAANAQKELTLLSVEDVGEEQRGSTAKLTIESVQGNGRVFASTSPLTKVDTQISARFAKDIACDFVDRACDRDFFYTVDANSAVVSGPSAGAAFAIGIIAEIEDLDLKSNVAVSATINSGGLLGPVGGLKKKIEAAARRGIDKVLIAKGSRYLHNVSEVIDLGSEGQIKIPVSRVNDTVDLVEFGKAFGIEVVEVSRLGEALSHFTGKPYASKNSVVKIDYEYERTMESLAAQLCARTDKLRNDISRVGDDNRSQSLYGGALNKSRQADEALGIEQFYSAASFCFAANIELQALIYDNLTDDEIGDVAFSIGRIQINKTDIGSLKNLQALMIVEDRLQDKDRYVGRLLNENMSKETAVGNLAYARERLFSALAWTAFLDNRTDPGYNIDEPLLREICNRKFEEAQERFDYASVYFPNLLSNTRQNLEYVLSNMEEENYLVCIYQASRVKAESDVVLGLLGVSEENVPLVVEEKISIAKEIIAEQNEFPIAAYSYVEYADALKEGSPQVALLYAEYALELADLDIYFPKNSMKRSSNGNFDMGTGWILFFGIVLGILIKRMFLTKRKFRRLVKTPANILRRLRGKRGDR